MKKKILFIGCILAGFFGFAQVAEQPIDSLTEKMIIIEGDSIVRNSIDLGEVYVFGKLEFPDYKSKLRYYILRRKTIKVFPYAKMAADRLTELNDSIGKIKKKRNSQNVKLVLSKTFHRNL